MVSKNLSVCLFVCLQTRPQLSQDWLKGNLTDTTVFNTVEAGDINLQSEILKTVSLSMHVHG